MGNKAYQLGHLIARGFRVPPGYVIPRVYLDELLLHNQQQDVFRRLLEDDGVLNRFHKLQKLIMGLELPALLRAELERLLEAYGTLAARSSAASEDASTSSMAGQYSSVTGIQTIEQLGDAVLSCFASAYSQGVYVQGNFGEGTAVIIQQYLAFEVGGVAFSESPDPAMERDVMAINAAPGGIEQIVSGISTGETSMVPRYGQVKPGKLLSTQTLLELRQLCSELEALSGGPVDVEWGLLRQQLYVVQSRPLTVRRKELDQACIVDIDDIAACSALDLGELRDKHWRWFDKKHHVRHACRKAGVNVSKVSYLLSPADAAQAGEAIARLSRQLGTPHLEVYDGRAFHLMAKEKLHSFCSRKTDGFATPLRLLVQEYIATQCCGFASRDAEGNIYVESLPGGFRSFWLEGSTPTTYLLSPEGAPLHEKLQRVDSYFRFDSQALDFVRVQVERAEEHKLTQRQLAAIVGLTGQLSALLGEVRIEWVFDGEEIRFFDLSEETRPLVETLGLGTVLSSGYAEGQACVLDDIHTFDALFDDVLSEVDVVPKAAFLELVQSEPCHALIRSVLQGADKPIVVAEYPKRTLAVMTDHVSGFVFERGALLCHLAIILREKGIPALVVEDARQAVRHGAQLSLANGKLLNHEEQGVKR
ncbi:PEP/pyruvate-binding domain-containing protein [Paenibacillus sp. 598K]|uniref:PEP/pyruvate-binding domain-containing protein n=1 Tax=Paenibacillus sp. 598K TaxID=1117987 RepID=UPI000FFED636|nr:PEP/pyruvate-binding domain-containing protein [Paenibacillus sp. 598K]